MAEYFAGNYLRFVNGEWRNDDGDIVEISRVRRGRWIYHRGDYRQECSCCHEELRLRGVGIAEHFGPCNENYCPNCGAKMEGWVIE